MYRPYPYRADRMELGRRHYTWPEDREKYPSLERRRIFDSRPTVRRPHRDEDTEQSRNAEAHKPVPEDDDTEELLEGTRKDWVAAIMRDRGGDRHVVKAKDNITPQALIKEHEVSTEKAPIFSYVKSSEQQLEEEWNRQNGYDCIFFPHWTKIPARSVKEQGEDTESPVDEGEDNESLVDEGEDDESLVDESEDDESLVDESEDGESLAEEGEDDESLAHSVKEEGEDTESLVEEHSVKGEEESDESIVEAHSVKGENEVNESPIGEHSVKGEEEDDESLIEAHAVKGEEEDDESFVEAHSVKGENEVNESLVEAHSVKGEDESLVKHEGNEEGSGKDSNTQTTQVILEGSQDACVSRASSDHTSNHHILGKRKRSLSEDSELQQRQSKRQRTKW